MKLWEGGEVNINSILKGWAISIPICLVSISLLELQVAVAVGFFMYLPFKYLERLLYNYFISNGSVDRAYAISILSISVEVIIFSLLVQRVNEVYARFILPSTILLAIFLLITVLVGIGKKKDKESKLNAFGFVSHSLFLVLVIMSDRYIISFLEFDNKVSIKDYLLMFGYASAVYTLVCSILEVKRAQLFIKAKEEPSVISYLIDNNFLGYFSIATLTFFMAFVVGVFINEQLYTIIVSQSANEVWFQILVFFYLYAMVSFVHIYYLSNRLFLTLFISWLCALAIKMAPLMLELDSVSAYLIWCSASAVVCISLSVFFGKINAISR
ncbi:hypothetical protein [Vibrio vulnificus]|uniref:hypothetical protein n=1 Tax=Vibrio vulnificus TaxID=672 RepID=UPI0011B1F12E|nr:hypothetical protein [Vibrio vulnificus]MBN8106890.1 hypothetical protein [Vibrio vulnificus]